MRNRKHAEAKRPGPVFGTLRFQVVFIMLICYFVPTAVFGLFTYNVLLRGMQEKTRSALSSGADYAWTQTVQNVEHAVNLSRGAIYDGELTGVFNRWDLGTIGDAEYLRLSREYLERKYGRDSMLTFAAYFPLERPDLFICTRSGEAEAAAVQEAAVNLLTAESEALDTDCRFVEYNGKAVLIRNLLNLRMERYGMLILGIDMEALLQPIRKTSEAWPAEAAVRLDDAGETEIRWEELTPGLTDLPKDETIRIVRFSDSEDYDLRMVLTVSRRQQYKELYEFNRVTLGIYLLLIPMLALIIWYVHRRIVRPIGLLSEASRRMEAGELGITVPMHGQDELGRLGTAFSNMSRRIEELVDKTYREELELKNAQIQALQSRINPHFINNALEDINWQARMEGSETISSMVSSLSVLLNATMARKDRHLVSLREEMEVAEAYIFFVQQRFGSDLEFRRDLEEKALDGVVPLLTVQPVLENAVEHGIAPAGGGRISISCRRAGDCLLITVSNTGRPIQPEDRKKIDAALNGETTGGSHLGLANIANRLRLIFGNRTSVEVRSEADGTTRVEMNIPQTPEKEEV